MFQDRVADHEGLHSFQKLRILLPFFGMITPGTTPILGSKSADCSEVAKRCTSKASQRGAEFIEIAGEKD